MIFEPLDLHAVAVAQGVDLEAALARLVELYRDVDARNAANTRTLDLPCRPGCDACCHESVFVTPLELLVAWGLAQAQLTAMELDAIVRSGLDIYTAQRARIEAFDQPDVGDPEQRTALARALRFRCPLLGDDGACRVYPLRPLNCRLFGCSFNDELGIYGCDLVGQHLGGRTVTLLPARGTSRRLDALPLGQGRQVIPHFLQRLYGGRE